MAIIRSTLRSMAMDRAVVHPSVIALDRGSVRTVDVDGRLHVALSNISKASVDSYYGHEIPGYDKLGLEPNRIYRMFRCPLELEKAAPSFNNLPILSKHIPVSADKPMKGFVIGSTGTDAAFVSPYLQNSSVIWDAQEIKEINSRRKKDWSCGYYYTPSMEAGNFNGLPYDGVMRNIVGNHVALVDQGRAGPDVMVGDKMPRGLAMIKSRRALMLNGALAAIIAPRLAADKALDLSGVLGGVTAKTRGTDTDALAASVLAIASPLIAADQTIDLAIISGAIMAADMCKDEDDMAEDDDDADEDEDDDDDKSPAAMAARMAAKKKKKDEMAKDRATLRAEIFAEAAAIRDAERAVAPHIGEVRTAHDSAAAVYKLALDHAKIDLHGVDPTAYKALVSMLPKAKKDDLALDAAPAGSKSFDERFGASNLIIS
jgi:hypothetical protein